MRFCKDDNDKAIEIKSPCFIYFLIKDQEVVYVGQTITGVSRPFQHKDKNYDKVKIIFTDKDKLDKMEDYYITKYNPMYNRQPNHRENWSFNIIKLKLLADYGLKINMWHIKRALKDTGIKPNIYYGVSYLKIDDAKALISHIVKSSGGKYAARG